jgi:predicted RNase H-like nuclease (RuvC/YqgF family)
VLSAEIDRLNKIVEQLQAELAELRIMFADQTALSKRINEHMALMVVLFAEIESLRLRLRNKEKEVEDVRRSSLAPFII